MNARRSNNLCFPLLCCRRSVSRLSNKEKVTWFNRNRKLNLHIGSPFKRVQPLYTKTKALFRDYQIHICCKPRETFSWNFPFSQVKGNLEKSNSQAALAKQCVFLLLRISIRIFCTNGFDWQFLFEINSSLERIHNSPGLLTRVPQKRSRDHSPGLRRQNHAVLEHAWK